MCRTARVRVSEREVRHRKGTSALREINNYIYMGNYIFMCYFVKKLFIFSLN